MSKISKTEKDSGGKRSNSRGRLWALLILCGLVFAAFIARLAWMQFAQADYYAEKIAAANETSYTVTVPAARGDITDRNGTLLAQDVTAYDVAIRLPGANAAEETTAGQSPQQALMQLQTLIAKDKFITEGGKDVETQLAAFSHAVWAGELTVATGLTPAEAAAVRQSRLVQCGAVRLIARGARCYPDGMLLPHTLGTTGTVTAAQRQDPAFAYATGNAITGQSGLELAYDALLHGSDGVLTVTARRNAATTERMTRPPIAGATLVSTIDGNLQSVLQQALLARMEELRTTKPAGKGREVSAAAACVVEIATGGVLAAVSLPGYDGNCYRTDYAALSADAAAPLMDRVCLGLYAPGSAFKPAVAASALANGIITPADTVHCGGRYTYYSGYQPGCLQLGHSGAIDLLTALQHSCNIYFYDVGRRLGVDAFSATAQALGLAADTGAELPQAAGRLTYSTDENYQPGLVLMSAIGQGNTAVTPLQLAAYAAALAGNGTRPALHFAEKALDFNSTATGRTVWQYSRPDFTPTPAPGGEAVFSVVREGMVRMASTLSALRDAPVSVGCKTGSPQLAETMPDGTHYTNSVLIAFAPADAPRIAVAIVLEHGGGGANAAPVLRAILDAFSSESAI